MKQGGVPRTQLCGGHRPAQGLDLGCISKSPGLSSLLERPGIIMVSSFTGGPHGSGGALVTAGAHLYPKEGLSWVDTWSRARRAESLRVCV